jgi:uncharacterized protein
MRTMDFKAVVLKAGTEGKDDDGRIRALVSVFNNIDAYGDVVMPGAFSEDLKAWEAKGDPIPFIWSHDWADPFSHVGVVEKAVEGEADGKHGLIVDAYISPEERAMNPKAAQVWRLLKARRVTQFSFAFDEEEGGWAERKAQTDAGDEISTEVYELRKLAIHEVGPCLLGVNSETELIAAKARRLTRIPGAPTRESLKNLQAARDALTEILDGHIEPPATSQAAAGGSQDTETAAAASGQPPAVTNLARATQLIGQEFLAEDYELEGEKP